MKNIFAILIAVGYCMVNSSCSVIGIYTKKQAIKKFCNKDTISTFVTIHDTIRTQTIQKDTIFAVANTNDTIYLERDKMVVKYYKRDSFVYISGTCKGDTIYINKNIKVKIPVLAPKPPKPTLWEKVILHSKNALSLIGIVFLVIIGFRFIISKLSK